MAKVKVKTETKRKFKLTLNQEEANVLFTLCGWHITGSGRAYEATAGIYHALINTKEVEYLADVFKRGSAVSNNG